MTIGAIHGRLEPIGVDALLIEAVKELNAENQELKERVTKLESAVDVLLAKNVEHDDAYSQSGRLTGGK